VLNCFKKYISSDKTYLGAVIGAGIIGFFEMTQTLGINLQFLNKIYIKLPLQTFGLAWVVPSLVFSLKRSNKVRFSYSFQLILFVKEIKLYVFLNIL